MRQLILGGTGNIGSSLLQHLRQSNEGVIGTSRKQEGDNLVMFNPFKDDWNTLGKFDVIINCIGVIRESHEYSFDKIHIDLAKLILKNRLRIGNPLIIQVSALGADAVHAVKFLRTKGIADNLLLKEENTFVMRPSIVCFKKTLLLKKIRWLRGIAKEFNHRILLPEDFADKYVQPVLITDLIEAVENVIMKGNKAWHVINMVGPDRISYRELICMKANNFEKSIRITEVNRCLSDLFVKGFIALLFPSLLNKEQYQLLFYDNIADAKDMENILGRAPLSTKKFWQDNLISSYGKS